ncbi:MAG: alpha-galactosidase [Phycisphaerae bacterium]|nr:alpha-galactosidase [Phycisphaerae bacterium]
MKNIATLKPEPAYSPVAAEDWLLVKGKYKAQVYRTITPGEFVLSNGLIRRVFRTMPNAATVGFDNLMTGQSMLRGVKPEARLTIDKKEYAVGGLLGQPDYAYLLPEWLDKMTADSAAFQFVGVSFGVSQERMAWKRKRYSPEAAWPAPGVSIAMEFRPPVEQLNGVRVFVHYELFDGIPLLSKWIRIQNDGDKAVRVDRFTSEVLAIVESGSPVESPKGWVYPNLHVETEYAFLGMEADGANKAVFWVPDPQYQTQVNYRLQTPCVLETRPPLGPAITIAAGGSFETFRTFELIHDSTDRERKGLSVRRMYRTIAPWAMENPILMHVRSADPKAVRLAVDQCAQVGFEMIILTFGSGFNIENESPEYLWKIRELVEYAHGKGIEIGGYSLLASRRINDENDVVNPETGKPGGFAAFDNSPCLGSAWAQDYFRKLYAFYEKTGFDLLEHDGSYPGDVCASTKHPGHEGLDDSQYKQWQTITQFYRWCRGRGIYLNVPDYYFLSGSNKTGMGYRETNWSLPREQQILHGRQNIFDGTWEKTPSMGWMFVPLTEYHGGGAAATIEPLKDHLDAYEAHLANNFGCGVQACYRGPRLFDAQETKAVVKKWVDFYKKYRPILDSDIIHVRRADGRDIDCMMHVNPHLPTKGLAVVYNPLGEAVQRKLVLPLYYTGLTETATIRHEEENGKQYRLDREYRVEIPVEMPARCVTWFVIE